MPKPAAPDAPRMPKPADDTIEVAQTQPATQGTAAITECSAKSQVTVRTPPLATTIPGPLLQPAGPLKKPDRCKEPNNGRCMTPEVAAMTTHAEGTIPQALRIARDKLSKQQTSGQPLAIKMEVIAELDAIIQKLGEDAADKEDQSTQQTTTISTRVSAMESELRDIKAMLKESLTAKERTWAQVAAQAGANGPGRAPESTRRERLEKLRREKAKTEVLLTMRNTSEQAKASIASTNEESLTKGLQEAVSKVGLDPAKIQAVKKAPSYGLRVCCPSEEAAEELRKLDWERGIEGAELVRPAYDIVVNGVSKQDIDFERDTPEEIKAKIEYSNSETIRVTRVAPLRKRAKNKGAPTHSIIVFTADPKEANECIIYGINIEHRRYAADRYAPQCQIKQCFNCQGYGHKADTCTRVVKCGKCAQSHETKKCSSSLLQCTHCKGPHAAWDHECPTRQKERQRREVEREEISPLFEC